MTKYQKTFQEMISQNQTLFDQFSQVHQLYIENPKQNQTEFNRIGQAVLEVIRRYENQLCSHSENSGFGKYSTNLASKFQQEVKKSFPKIDWVGVTRK
ncbi:hypothetical protein M1563_03985 [Patescibacteria group bacterium]|nr:hypothetical protein [Patescibacteria group bacterium]MCL5409355.1 hypothetical protein [Patescibacteria group bacterium]